MRSDSTGATALGMPLAGLMAVRVKAVNKTWTRKNQGFFPKSMLLVLNNMAVPVPHMPLDCGCGCLAPSHLLPVDMHSLGIIRRHGTGSIGLYKLACLSLLLDNRVSRRSCMISNSHGE